MKSKSVLLVDDSPAFLRSASSFLAVDGGFRVIGMALSGPEALAKIKILQPEVVFLDLEMPGMDGVETLRAIKRMKDAPIIVILTLHDGTEYRRRALDAGADAFISKAEFTGALPWIGGKLAARRRGHKARVTSGSSGT